MELIVRTENSSSNVADSPKTALFMETERRPTTTCTPNTPIQAIASQIPEFAGTEDDNILAWVRRVDKVAQVHRTSDGMTLLAASSRLVKSARRWFDVQADDAVESWQGLRTELIKIFD